MGKRDRGCGASTSNTGGQTDTVVVDTSTTGETTGDDTGSPPPCNPAVADGHCPSVCGMANDIDCCPAGHVLWQDGACPVSSTPLTLPTTRILPTSA